MQPTYQNEGVGVTGTGKMSTSLNNNLSELDSLLQDLSNSRYSERRGEFVKSLVPIQKLAI